MAAAQPPDKNAAKILALEKKFTEPRPQLAAAGRKFISEGVLQKKTVGVKNETYHFAVFSDTLVFSSFNDNKTMTLRGSCPMDASFKVEGLPDLPDMPGLKPHRFQISSSTGSFIVYAKSAKEKGYWMEDLAKVRDDNVRSGRPGATVCASSGGVAAPAAPQAAKALRTDAKKDEGARSWTKDKECKECSHCNAKFTFLRRRHHCRACGHIYCNDCCENRTELPQFGCEGPQRVCLACWYVAAGAPTFSCFFARANAYPAPAPLPGRATSPTRTSRWPRRRWASSRFRPSFSSST